MRPSARRFDVWNRRLHYYLGLYFLFFLWLFSVTGLMLNHQSWISRLYERKQTSYELPIAVPSDEDVKAQTFDLMEQLELVGEADWPASQPAGHIDFSVSRPSESTQVRADINARTVYIRHFQNNLKLAFQVFHTFSGSRYNQPGTGRDWIVTTAWVVAMDALAVGLMAMVAGGLYMWWRLGNKRAAGLVSLGAGVGACAVFLGGLL